MLAVSDALTEMVTVPPLTSRSNGSITVPPTLWTDTLAGWTATADGYAKAIVGR